MSHHPDLQRDFAIEVVQRLRQHGFQALWAGGCVRDLLLKRVPKDYDVATNATPTQVIELFGRKRTVPVGAAFGVIMVCGPKGAGQVEVATFREDDNYSDGRRPDSVRYSTPERDAQRRDFTINGMFYDPLERKVHDFVGGESDLAAQVIRAIGVARERFQEDKLRMLRAVRFAATFHFHLDSITRAALEAMVDEITIVSAERIHAELVRMLEHPGRAIAVRLLVETGLMRVVLPEVLAVHPPIERGDAEWIRNPAWQITLETLDELEHPSFPAALAMLLWPATSEGDRAAELVTAIAARLRVSNDERDRTLWLVRHHDAIDAAGEQPWSKLQPILISPGIHDLIAIHRARAAALGDAFDDVDFCRAKLLLPPEELNPPPLIDGRDLMSLGIPRGPIYRTLLEQARNAQLDGEATSRAAALSLVERKYREG